MDAREQTLNLLGRIWVKLQGLPNANPIELGAFFVLLTFIREFFIYMFFPPHCLFINKLVMTLFICCSHTVVVLLITVVTCASFCCGCCSCCCRKRKLKGSDLWAKTDKTTSSPHSESWSCFRNTHTQELYRVHAVLCSTKEPQPLDNKTPAKHRKGCPATLPNTPAQVNRLSGESTFLGASLHSQQRSLRTGRGQLQLCVNQAETSWTIQDWTRVWN